VVSFFEDGRENGEVGTFGSSARDIGSGVTGNGNTEVGSGQWPVARGFEDSANFTRSNVVATEVDAIRAGGERDVGTGVDEKTSRRPFLAVRCSRFTDDADGFAS